MNIVFTARKKGDDETYIPLKEQGLTTSAEKKGGEGTPERPYLMQLQVTNPEKTAWSGVVHCTLPFEKKNPLFFLPGFMYGTNRGEAPLLVPSEYPRMREGNSRRPASGWWMTRSDRLSHPVVMTVNNGRLFGFSASPYYICKDGRVVEWDVGKEGEFVQYAGFTCSLDEGNIGYTLGYENAPWLFVESHNVKERAPLGENCFSLEPGETVSFILKVYDFAAGDERAVHQVIEQVYREYHESPRRAAGTEEAVGDLAAAISRDAWLEEDKGYCGIVYLKEDKSLEYTKIPSIAWTNGLSVAVPMLMSGLRLENDTMREQALTCINHIVDNSMNPDSGLPYESWSGGKWSNHGWWFDNIHNQGHTAYLTGQTMYYLLKVYDYEKKEKGIEHQAWIDFVGKISEKAEQTKNADQEYPFILSEKNGIGIEYDAFAGAWIMAAQAFFCYLFDKELLLREVKKSEAHYYDAYVKKLQCYGAPLDTDKAIDSEGILAYIRAVRFLHMKTGEEIYLDHLRDALCYEYSFKFCYNSPIKIPPLSRLGWSSCGGSITSVANPHIHPMSSTVTDEMLYYIRHRPDEYVESRLSDTIKWGLQCYNRYDGEFDYGYKGWMSERFCHCEGLLVQKYPDDSVASTWFALMPWAGSSILEGLTGDCWNERIKYCKQRF